MIKNIDVNFEYMWNEVTHIKPKRDIMVNKNFINSNLKIISKHLIGFISETQDYDYTSMYFPKPKNRVVDEMDYNNFINTIGNIVEKYSDKI